MLMYNVISVFKHSIDSYRCSSLVDYNLQSRVVYRLFSVSIMLARNTFILIYCVVFHTSVQHPVACVIKVTKITVYATLCIVLLEDTLPQRSIYAALNSTSGKQ
jgi:hypothetical protein